MVSSMPIGDFLYWMQLNLTHPDLNCFTLSVLVYLDIHISESEVQVGYQMTTLFTQISRKSRTPVIIRTHWGWVTNIYISNITIIGSDNGLWPGRCQAIIWTNAWILLIGLLGTNFSEILIKNRIFSFKKMLLKMSSGKWRQFCFGLNVLMFVSSFIHLQMKI